MIHMQLSCGGRSLVRSQPCQSCARRTIVSLSGRRDASGRTRMTASQAVSADQAVEVTASARLLAKVRALKLKKAPESEAKAEQPAPARQPAPSAAPATVEIAPASVWDEVWNGVDQPDPATGVSNTAGYANAPARPAATLSNTGRTAARAAAVAAAPGRATEDVARPAVRSFGQRRPAERGTAPDGPSTSGPAEAAKHSFDLKTGLAVAWLGTSSGAPTKERNVSCILLRSPEAVYMVDCGEGTRRQLQQLDFDVALIDGIFITHLHGDHCFGAASTLLHLDVAKRRQADLPAARKCNRLVGPPGIASLLRASLGITGLVHELTLPLSITELVVHPDEAHPPRPLMANGAAPHVTVRRLAARPVADDPTLQANLEALDAEQPKLPSIWRPRGGTSNNINNFVAEPGVYWDLPAGPRMRVRSAQLQHRVACWGYVFTEMTGSPDGDMQDGRKVVLLGDTVSSRCMAPLAYGADLISHEATFQEGMEQKACIAQHSTGWMAGMFAHAVHARALVLTHFSSRYHNNDDLYPVRQNVVEEEKQAVMEQRTAISQLIAEARHEFPDGVISAARDFHVQHVPVSEGGRSWAEQVLADARGL